MPEERTAEDRFKLEGTVLSDRIEVHYLVAEGGFGLVYRAYHRTMQMDVALKVLLPPPELTPAQLDEFVINFAMEARTLERLVHPNIVRVVDTGEAVMPSGHHTGFIALEWIDGVVLEDELEERRGKGGRTPAEVFALMRGVLEALTSVHRQGIAHRDLKPGNIIISSTPEGPLVRLLDFGIAKWMRSDERAGSGRTRTFSNLQAYSPQYASPEQLTGARTGPWTDVHAAALMLSELITDQPPLEGSTFPQLLSSAMNPLRPTPLRRKIDVGAWEPVLRKALSIRPDDRFHDAGEFLAALEVALPGAMKRSLNEIDPDDPALARTLSSTPAPAAAPAKHSSGPPGASWVRAPQRPGTPQPPHPPTSEPSVQLTASLNPSASPRPSTPLHASRAPAGPTLPPSRNTDLTGPLPAAQAPPAPSSNARSLLVLIGGIALGAAVALGAAAALGLLKPPAPIMTQPPAPGRTRVPRPHIEPALGHATDAARVEEDATVDAARVEDASAEVTAEADAGEIAAPRARSRRHRRHRRHRTDSE